MVMSWIWIGILSVSMLVAILEGRGSELSAAVAQGAQGGFALSISIAGSLCLWSGVGKLMDHAGITKRLSVLIRPILKRIFPSAGHNETLSKSLSANICANFLGLGNAATPMGIQAVKEMIDPVSPDSATDEMCRLIVLNTASIQMIPANVAAVRASLGCPAPFDILPAVWLTSACSAGLGLLSAWILGKLWKHD